MAVHPAGFIEHGAGSDLDSGGPHNPRGGRNSHLCVFIAVIVRAVTTAGVAGRGVPIPREPEREAVEGAFAGPGHARKLAVTFPDGGDGGLEAGCPAFWRLVIVAVATTATAGAGAAAAAVVAIAAILAGACDRVIAIARIRRALHYLSKAARYYALRAIIHAVAVAGDTA